MTKEIEVISLRIAVSILGETADPKWWNSNWFSASADRFLNPVFGNEFVYLGSGFEYSYQTSSDFDMLLYKVTDGQSESSVSTVVYDNRPSQFREFPIALNNDINIDIKDKNGEILNSISLKN